MVAAALLALTAAIAYFWPPVPWSLAVTGPVVAQGLHDGLQTRRTILRNFPVLGRLRYALEAIRPEIQQYFIESNVDAFPIERELRSLVYQRAKGELETRPFGTQRDVYKPGYEWASHALAETAPLAEEPRLLVGPGCAKPYSASRLNISAMSFGSLSPTAVQALNRGALLGGFAHNTGEGGISPHHLQVGDLIWQVGTGYFGCRSSDGGFDEEKFAANVGWETVRMVELKLSQGAKPGHGGVLPAAKVSPEIASIRGVPVHQTVLSPPRHSAFRTPIEMMHFVARLRDRIRIFASGKIITGFHMVRALALGADACNSARGMMLAIGCIQSLRCNNDTCPTGVATQNPALYKGLVVAEKDQRVARFHKATIHSLLELLAAMGVSGPDAVTPNLIFRRMDDMRILTFAELNLFLEPRCQVDGADVPGFWRGAWDRARADTFAT
ncbi:MAG TPA: FMN-binding glutamate synthase family protein [Planctomycetota bacterium]